MLNQSLARRRGANWRRDAADKLEAADRRQEAARLANAGEGDRPRRRSRWKRPTRGAHSGTNRHNAVPVGPVLRPGILPSRSTRLPW